MNRTICSPWMRRTKVSRITSPRPLKDTLELARDAGDRVLVLHVHEFAYGRFGRMQVDCVEGGGEAVVEQIVSELRAACVTADGDG